MTALDLMIQNHDRQTIAVNASGELYWYVVLVRGHPFRDKMN